MNKIDYKMFVPRGESNYIRVVSSGIEFLIDDIMTVNIHISDDRVNYWLYFSIAQDDQHHRVILQKKNKPKFVLLIGNNQYEIHGEGEIMETSLQKWKEQIQITLSFTVYNASQTVNNPRKENPTSRYELLDI